jgi:hypothetical protein
MKYEMVKDGIAIFPHSILPTVQGKPDYKTIHAIQGGGALGHLGFIVSTGWFAMIAPATEAGPTLWESPTTPGWDPGNTDGTASQISAAQHTWDEEVQTYRTCTYVHRALKKRLSLFFKPCIWTF